MRVMTHPSAILFVNIGWAEHYRGDEEIRGNHGHLRKFANDNAEHAAFLPDQRGVYTCGIGEGTVRASRLDVVFVARHPEKGGHYAVGLYRNASWTADNGSEIKPWLRAHTTTAFLIFTRDRPIVDWPGKMNMRRWAKRAFGDKGREYEHLYQCYQNVLALVQSRQPPAVARPNPPHAPPKLAPMPPKSVSFQSHPSPPKLGLPVPTPTPAPRKVGLLKPGPLPPKPVRPPIPVSAAVQIHSRPLALRNDGDLLVLREGTTEPRQQLHNSMTNALFKICACRNLEVRQGNDPEFQFDALIENYDGAERDLLIEVKTSIEPAFCRMAVGQLFDYRRGLSNRDCTDLAVLFPERPGEHVHAFLEDVEVRLLWLTQDKLHIEGDMSL